MASSPGNDEAWCYLMEPDGQHEFPTRTDWSAVLRCLTVDPGRRRQAVSLIAGQYWKPVYCYLLRKCGQVQEAEDLTQGFFEQVVLGKELIQQADAEKGKFRTFLLAALNNYVRGEHRRQNTQKRAPANKLVSLAGLEESHLPQPTANATPEQAYTFTWASTLLNTVLTEVEAHCTRDGLGSHWAVFQGRVLLPIFENTDPLPLAQLCAQHGIASEATASAMVITVNRRFEKALRSRVRPLVNTDEEVEEEIRELMQICSSFRAGF